MVNRFCWVAQCGVFLTLSISCAELLPSPSEVQPVEQARALLRSGKISQADRVIRNARETSPDDARLLCVSGDILFRQADFSNAAQTYKSALSLDANSASAYLGLARIAQLEFRRKTARDLFSEARRLDPNNPEIRAAYSRSMTELQTRSYFRLSSAYAQYELQLTAFHPTSSSSSGILVTARINGGKPLRLVFDTGFSGIIVNGKAARSLGLQAVTQTQFVGGLGDGRPHTVQPARARTVAFGNLEFGDCPIQVDEGSVTLGADGVVGADVFAPFEIKLDARAQRLALVPFSGEGQANVYGVNHLLLVKMKINRQKEGLFLLDTAAAFSSVSEEIARPWEHRATVPLMGARGLLAHVYRVPPVEFEFGGQQLIDPTPVALDLRQMSQQIGLEVAGVLGYSLLSRSRLIINYRDGIVQLTDDSTR